jgi:TatD DNase family protein
LNYLDIHTHTYYTHPETTILLNVFPGETEKLDLPVFFSVGLHPWHIHETTWPSQVDMVRTAARNPKVLAIGECGFDKTIRIPFALQQEVFLAQLALAESVSKPLIIHCVRSYSEMLALRKKSDQSIPWIFQWFNADEHIARELIRKNCLLSFGHMLFREHSKAFRVFQTLSPDHLFLETDDSGFTVTAIYHQAAFLQNMSVHDLKTRIMANFGRCFQG